MWLFLWEGERQTRGGKQRKECVLGPLRKLRKEKTSFSPNEEIKDILVVPEQGWGDASPSPAGGEQVPYTGAGAALPS